MTVAKLLEFEPTGVRVPCRQCGADVELDAWVLARVEQFNATLERRNERLLASDELVVCGDPDCRAAEEHRFAERTAADEREVLRLILAARNGDPVYMPPGFARERPADYQRVQSAIRAAREERGNA